MRFFITSSLYYYAAGPSTLLCSLSCGKTSGQAVFQESLTTSRQVTRTDLLVGQERNRLTRLEIKDAGDLAVHYLATAQTTSNTMPVARVAKRKAEDLGAPVIPYLFPSRYAPSDRLRAAAMDLFGGIKGALNQALAIEEWLFKHIAYTIGSSTEQSCSRDTLELRSGVCRDFAHLGISFCRALCIPARYVTVYAYQLYPQDFHAVFEVHLNGIWYVIDGTRKAPLNGMIRIATGRDASDAAVATLFGNIQGQGIYVETAISDDAVGEFLPVTREMLLEKEEILYLG